MKEIGRGKGAGSLSNSGIGSGPPGVRGRAGGANSSNLNNKPCSTRADAGNLRLRGWSRRTTCTERHGSTYSTSQGTHVLPSAESATFFILTRSFDYARSS